MVDQKKKWFKTGPYGQIWGRIGELRDYLSEIEIKFDFDSGKLNQALGIEIQERGPDPDGYEDIYDHYRDEFYRIDYLFPRMFRYAAVTALYSLLESAMEILCRHVRQSKNLTPELKDISGKGIQRARRYLVEEGGINFPDDSNVWKKIVKLNKIRNCLTHADGNIEPMTNKKELEGIVKSSKGLSLEHNHYILIDKEYVQEATRWVEEFLGDLFDTSLSGR